MNTLTLYNGSQFDIGTLDNLARERGSYEDVVKEVYKAAGGIGLTLSEFLNLQKSSEGSAELVSYLDEKGLSIRSLGDEAKIINDQINTQAALQTLQNFYDMYISPTQGDAQYRLGEVTGRASPGTKNNQTDSDGRMLTRSLFNTVLKYKVWQGDGLKDSEEHYSVLWFPPFKPSGVKAASWKGAKVVTDGNNATTQIMSMNDYLAEAKAKRQKELDEENAKLLESGQEITQTEADDSRLVKNAAATNDNDKYFETFDLNTFKAARSTFTYRAPGFKAINDNINMIQWLLEGCSGIVSTYLTEWDISLYLQEGLITDNDGKLPNLIMLTHRMAADNPSGYTDERAAVYGVINCAISKVKADYHKNWVINAYPYSTWHTLYPDPTKFSGWLDKVSQDGNVVYVPSWYKFGRNGLSSYLAGEDVGRRPREDNISSRLMYQDFENAALSGYKEWNFDNKIYKALYTSDDDGFSDVDLIFLSTSCGLFKKKDLIDQVEMVLYGVASNGEPYDGSEIVAGDDGSGNNNISVDQDTYPFEEGSGGNKYCPGNVFKGALTFLNMFNKKDSSKESAMSKANSMNNSSSGNTYGTMQDSLGLVKQAASGQPCEPEGSPYLLGTEKCLTENSNGVGVPQYNPTLYGGPHGYYRSPQSYQSYYQENSVYLRNVPRLDKMPEDFKHDSWSGITWPSLPASQDDYFYKGNEKWCSNVSAVANGERQSFEQSWGAGFARLREGVHSFSTQTAYIRRRHDTKIEGHMYRRIPSWVAYWFGWFGWLSSLWAGFEIGWDTTIKCASNDLGTSETLHRYGDYWYEWRESTLFSNAWWWSSLWSNWAWADAYNRYKQFYFSWDWSWGWRCILHRYVPVQWAWHYTWQYAPFKRYVLHNGFVDYNYKIAEVQHYDANLSPSAANNFRNQWASTFAHIFGYSTPIERCYLTASTEDYELFIDDAGQQPGTLFSAYDELYHEVISSYMTTKEHDVLDYLVDWGRGIGAHNKVMFLTRTTGDNPDCLFRCEVYHLMKPIWYWCEHSKTYSSKKCKHWFERHCGWKHYISVRLDTTDRFYAGLSKPAFTNYGSNFGIVSRSKAIQDSTVPLNGHIGSIKDHSFFNITDDCSETRKSPYDLYENSITGRRYPHFNPFKNSDEMATAMRGIRGKGIIGDIPGLDFIADDSDIEKFSDKCCIQDGDVLNKTFGSLRFPFWKITSFTLGDVSINGNTYRVPGGYMTYAEGGAPSWWSNMILNMSLRNTFYRGDKSGPQKATFSLKQWQIDVTGCIAPNEAGSIIESRGAKVLLEGEELIITASNVKSYTTYQQYATVTKDIGGKPTPVNELRDYVDTVTLKNAWVGAKYYFTSYDMAPRFMYNLVATQNGFLEGAKDLLCGHIKDSQGRDTGKYIVSFDYIRDIMTGTSRSAPLISPRTYYLANPTKQEIEDPDGNILHGEKKYSKCEDMYGYNQFIVWAREWFDNSSAINYQKHRELEEGFNRRITTLADMNTKLKQYINLDIKNYSFNTMVQSWRDMNAFIELKNDEGIEKFFLAYLNVLYESRRYFINKRCNKQDGTLWACRHLEKMVPQMIASAVASGAGVVTSEFNRTIGKEKVAFYEVQNTLEMKSEAMKKIANGEDVKLETDRIKTIYVKVKYATEKDYKDCQAKLKDGTLTPNDETIIKIRPWNYIKKRDGTFKNKANGDLINADKGEFWNNDGWAIKYGKEKYAIKPTNGNYGIFSKEVKAEMKDRKKKGIDPKTSANIKDFDLYKNQVYSDGDSFDPFYINWDDLAATPNGIVFNLFGGTAVDRIRDLTQAGVTDPQAILCAAKQSTDYWRIPVGGTMPRAEGYKTDITIEFCEETNEFSQTMDSKNPAALTGAAAYAMWPIIEEQTDVIPNSGDLAISLQGFGKN